MYKLSSYNFCVPYYHRMVYFNGITSKVFSVTREEHDKLMSLFTDLISFEINYNSVFQLFKEWGFIIDEQLNEIDVLRYRNRQAVFLDRCYHLVINPTLECNFHCWYCYEKHPKGSMNADIVERCKRHIWHMVTCEKITGLNLMWFGGEPLLYFNEVVYPIGLYAKELCAENHIPFYHYATTNAYKINEEMVAKMQEIGFNGFQITIDGDQERHDKIRNERGKPTFDIIMRNVNLLCENLENARITLRVNYDNETLQVSDFTRVFEKISPRWRSHVSFDFQRVWQTVKSSLNENQTKIQLLEKSKEMGYKQTAMSPAFRIGKTHTCYVDRIYHAEINYDGKVYRCTARDYSDKYVVGELLNNGKIQWDEQKIALRYAKATFENEMCLACKYLPLCMGPCSQKLLETPVEKLNHLCYLNCAEIKPESVILDYYKQKMEVVKKMQTSEAKLQAV